ncbi:hypothetical protein C5167_049381 [Papaver somniferum]|uniref:Brix domain-containing protein n=1 Tax=Papaver somniferum TaxID=3469 RepID=A0A4Y7KKN0_PAPSO|nr:hypothetical protein C5167_049381 [Papaver somniferum]
MKMGGKRKKDEGEAAAEEEREVKPCNMKRQVLPSTIKNKDKRAAVHSQLKHEKKVEKRKKQKDREAKEKKAMELGEELPPRPTPHTIETRRVPDETIFICWDDVDEFSGFLKQEITPKILITTCRFNSARGPAFISELLTVIQNAHYFKRGTYDLKKIVEYANKKDFTSIVVLHTNSRQPDALLIIGLPDGPTAHFKLSSLVLRKDIKNHGNPTLHMPELVMNNFTTRLGHRVGRYIFDQKEIKPLDGKGKNKETKEKKLGKVITRMQECGPRLISLQHGTFDTKGGEYEWVHKPEMDTSRRRFFL